MAKEICCPRISKQKWDKKIHVWKDKPFYKDSYLALFYMPLNLGQKITQAMQTLEKKKVLGEQMLLCRNETPWGGDIYVPLKKNTDSVPSETISGKFLSMYFEGKGYQETGKWMKELMDYCKNKKYDIKEIISYYATCPKCAQKYGTIQTVLFARLS